MPDTGYLQVTLAGTCGSQSINNLLYYGGDVGEQYANWDTPIIGAVLTELSETLLTEYLATLPTVYTLNRLVGRVVDSRGNVVSDNAVELDVSTAGTLTEAINGPFQVGILRFPTERIDSEGSRALKRSYIAVGPLIRTAMQTDGALTLAMTNALQDLADLLSVPLEVGVESFWPVRVGRTVSPEQIAVGRVLSVEVDPYGSFRKSRKRRANGS